jgi:aminoglycoside 3-N-acetyltransferase
VSLAVLHREDLIATLQAVGVKRGDGLLVHSALQVLGHPAGGLQMYLDVLQETIGSDGTIAVPTFTFTFHKGEDYDPDTTPSKGMGSFSEFVRAHPQSKRTSHPMQPLSILGFHANELVRRDTLSAFDDGSAFDRMLQLEFKLLLLGADIQAASIVHYSEQRADVPYRYWKEFTGRVKQDGDWHQRTYRMYVRDLQIDAELRLLPIQKVLETRKQWRSCPLNYGAIACCKMRDFVSSTNSLLSRDPWALVASKPQEIGIN